MRARRAVVSAAAAVGGLLALSGCGFSGLYNIPLPGGAALGSHPYTVTAEFGDALDLVPQSAVRVNEVPVGRVSSITIGADGRTAEVKLTINGSVHLPANAVAAVEQTSLLGEKYVALAAPTGVAPTGSLTDGAHIPLSRTASGIQVEQVFGALSLLLNGGGLGQLQTIEVELNKAQSGNTPVFRSLLTSLDSVVGQLNAHRTDLTTALDQLQTLSANLRSNDTKISNVLGELSPGLAVLAQERTQLTAMLTALDRLSAVSVSTIDASQADTVADLKLLTPVLGQLAAAGSALPDSLQVLFTYPFPDAALGAIRGDYVNAFITLDLASSAAEIGASTTVAVQQGLTAPAATSASATSASAPPPSLLPPTSAASPGLPAVVTTSPGGSSSPTTTPTSPSASGSSTSDSPSPSTSASASTSPTKSPTPRPTRTRKGGR